MFVRNGNSVFDHQEYLRYAIYAWNRGTNKNNRFGNEIATSNKLDFVYALVDLKSLDWTFLHTCCSKVGKLNKFPQFPKPNFIYPLPSIQDFSLTIHSA